MRCNKCGKLLVEMNSVIREDYLHVVKEWGYFSQKDGTIQEFVLCEICTDRLINEMVIPVTTREKTEWL